MYQIVLYNTDLKRCPAGLSWLMYTNHNHSIGGDVSCLYTNPMSRNVAFNRSERAESVIHVLVTHNVALCILYQFYNYQKFTIIQNQIMLFTLQGGGGGGMGGVPLGT